MAVRLLCRVLGMLPSLVRCDGIKDALALPVNSIEFLPGIFQALWIVLAREEIGFSCCHNLIEPFKARAIASKFLVVGDWWLDVTHLTMPPGLLY